MQNLLKIIARYNVSIVTITQSAPVDGTAAVSITMKVKDMVGDVEQPCRRNETAELCCNRKAHYADI